MLSKKTQKGILYGFLGGVVGFVFAVAIFILSCAISFKAGWTFPIYPLQILIGSVIIATLVLVLSMILKIKKFGTLAALVIFSIGYFITIKISRITHLPIEAEEVSIIWAVFRILPLLIWFMFIYGGVKKGLFIANKNNK